jgi:hypothetical protein
VCGLFLFFGFFLARFIALPPVKDLKQLRRALQAENLRFESINGTYERAVMRQLRTLMVTINIAPFKPIEKTLRGFQLESSRFRVTEKASK